MPKCPNCPQFTSKETDQEPEVDISVDEEGMVTGTVRIVNTCSNCGEELEEYTFDVEADLTDQIQEHMANAAKKSKGKKSHTVHLEVDLSPERTDDILVGHGAGLRTTRTGKPIKNPRYMKRLYGASGDIVVSCVCGMSFSLPWADSIQASGMESLV